MKLLKLIKKYFYNFFIIFVALLSIFSPNYSVFAADSITDSVLEFNAKNNQLYYNPNGDYCVGDYTYSTTVAPGDTNKDKIWNFFVNANIEGFSNNAAAIAGVMGNIQQESNFQPFAQTGNYYGLVQWGYLHKGNRTAEANMIDEVSKIGNYWHKDNQTSKAPVTDTDKAINIELNYLINQDRFKEYLNGLNKTDNQSGTAGAESYADLFLVEVEKATGGSDTLQDSYAQSKATQSHYQNAANRRKYAAEIYQQYSKYSTTVSVGGVGTGDFDKIMTAKNANKQYTDFDPPGATFSDDSTESMKTLLENYGDLAYQLGEAVGAPWIAILVQMRYEDPHSICGKNNFWGNGCPPGTGAGGAKIHGSNLGEGFQQYGKTLTNGYHDQALGITDPKEYLEKIGPTWVQGNINGAGYGSINGMKKSVEALQNFVDSPEGQAIVKTFGNYHPSASISSHCIPRTGASGATNVGDAAKIPKDERLAWLFPNGVPTTASAVQPYLTTISVPILDINGNKTTMKLTLHKSIATEMEAVFNDLVQAGFRVKPSTTGMYNWRQNGIKSEHSLGLAIDINWDINPDYKPAPSNPSSVYSAESTDPLKVDDEIVRIFHDHGFYWGGCYSNRVDLMHFGYRDKPNTAITQTRYAICAEQ